MDIKKIAIIGPESSGKTTLSEQLAVHFSGVVVPEHARGYLSENGPAYGFEDLWKIAEGQLRLEDEVVSSPGVRAAKQPVFIDTELTVIRIWSEIVFGRTDNRILTSIASRQYDHYLLTFPDLPWKPDPLREYPDEKERIRHFHHYHDSMINQHVPFSVVRGGEEERLSRAISAVSFLFD